MLNILDVDPKIHGTPTAPLRRAAEQLKEAAESADFQAWEAIRIRNRYISRALPGATPPGPPTLPPSLPLDEFREVISNKIARTYGKLKGPSQNAMSEFGYLAQRAQRAGYRLEIENVQDKFLAFLMAYVTEGFVELDTTGTQIGNYQGSWRGGGVD